MNIIQSTVQGYGSEGRLCNRAERHLTVPLVPISVSRMRGDDAFMKHCSRSSISTLQHISATTTVLKSDVTAVHGMSDLTTNALTPEITLIELRTSRIHLSPSTDSPKKLSAEEQHGLSLV